VIIAALGGTYAWTQTQYFVGRAGSLVAVYQGVNTEFGPLKFYNLDYTTKLPIADLNPSVQSRVISGIAASSKTDAKNIVDSLLTNQLLAPCRAATPTPTPTPTTSAASSTPTPHASSSGSHHSPARRGPSPSTSTAPSTSSTPLPPSPTATCPVPIPS
jgi:protein phosphatase